MINYGPVLTGVNPVLTPCWCSSTSRVGVGRDAILLELLYLYPMGAPMSLFGSVPAILFLCWFCWAPCPPFPINFTCSSPPHLGTPHCFLSPPYSFHQLAHAGANHVRRWHCCNPTPPQHFCSTTPSPV